MNTELIKKIYESTIDIVLDGIESDYVSYVSNAYMDYLVEDYSKLSIGNDKIEKACELFVDLETSKWINDSSEIKKAKLIKDESLEKLGQLSESAFKHAQNRHLNNQITIDMDKAKQYIELMNNYASKVKPFNKDMAKFYMSEGIIDFEYACGKTENTSLRVARLR